MTLSIYYANFFTSRNIKEFLFSMETQMLTAELVMIGGAPGCTLFKTMYKTYPFCFANDDIRNQIQVAAVKFLNCRPARNQNYKDLFKLLGPCDFDKVDLSVNGPFGTSGPKIKEVMDKIKAGQGEKKIDWAAMGVNPYYIKKGVPGDEVKKSTSSISIQTNFQSSSSHTY